ncbi:MAG: hypothetical protein A3E80_06115 [Chlamydiae bacterium RIFCSPHIGHO2_12_FULL_49_9]|nr:MAG: hypothetical protein A3E80_06115 [Chlamydiae bacterium RIFCSPHIGHO2_12_FULL_49_9]
MKALLYFCWIGMVLSAGVACSGEEPPRFYGNTYNGPLSPNEEKMVNHAIISYSKAVNKESKLNENSRFASDTRCNSKFGIIPYYHLANNLCSLPNSTHLHIGLYTGGSFVSALYNNQHLLKEKIGIDWFEDEGYKRVFYAVCDKYLRSNDDENVYFIIERDCFSVDVSNFTNPIDIYIYDAGHSFSAHEQAFTYYNQAFADVFIAVVDDWEWAEVRQATFNAFDKLRYTILYQNEIRCHKKTGNGQYIAVIKKSF